MEKRLEYYCKKIDKAIKDNNKSDAEMYYKKALKNIEENEEILAFKSSIENIKAKTTVDENSTQENSKTLKSNEGLITLIAVLVAAAVLIIYCCTSIFPKYSLYRKLNHTWYVGDVSTSHSDGLALEFEFDDNYTFELSYRFWKDSDYFAISTFSGQILNGNEISLDGRIIKVDFEENGAVVEFSPSFIGLGDKSTWKMYDIGIGGNEYFEGADFASSTTSSNDQSATSNKTNASSSEFTNSSPNNEDETETNTSSVNSTTNNSDTSSKVSSSNTVTSKPVSSTQATSKPTVSKDPCANGHSWEDATCTSPATCSVCKKTSGKSIGHKWKEITSIVHHEEEGHYEDVEEAEKVKKYRCHCCGYDKPTYSTLAEYYSHFDNTHTDPYYALNREYYEIIDEWEYKTVSEWVVDKEAYDETVVTGHKCEVCGENK